MVRGHHSLRRPPLDLNNSEDSRAEADLNVVMTVALHPIEVQGTAEREPFPRTLLTQMLDLAEIALRRNAQAHLEAFGGQAARASTYLLWRAPTLAVRLAPAGAVR